MAKVFKANKKAAKPVKAKAPKAAKKAKKSSGSNHPNMVTGKKFKTKIGLQEIETPMVGLKSGTAVPEDYYKDFIALTTNRDELIHNESVFYSFAEFQKTFGQWKKKYLHPMRVASSEVLRETNGTVNEQFQYRYVTFHCTHYGNPRIRGSGLRPNQKYLPCGCRSMLRLAFDYKGGCLRVTTLNPIHMGHIVSEEDYRDVTRKCKHNDEVVEGEARVVEEVEQEAPVVKAKPEPEPEPVEEEPSAKDQMLAKYRAIQADLAKDLERLKKEREVLIASSSAETDSPSPPAQSEVAIDNDVTDINKHFTILPQPTNSFHTDPQFSAFSPFRPWVPTTMPAYNPNVDYVAIMESLRTMVPMTPSVYPQQQL